MGPSAYQVATAVIPMPNARHVDDLSGVEIDQVQRAISMLRSFQIIFSTISKLMSLASIWES
jgi:hypothetical protein